MKQYVMSILVATVSLVGCSESDSAGKRNAHGDFTVNDGAYTWEYSLAGANNATLIHVYTSESEVVIPEEIRDVTQGKTLKVTGIGLLTESLYDVFDLTPVLSGAVKSVSIPASVVRIGPGAFGNLSSLTGITFQAAVKTKGNSFRKYGESCSVSVDGESRLESVGILAFVNCTSIKEVTLPSSVKSIGDSAFQGCASLERLKVGDGLEEFGWGVVDGCSALKEFFLPERFANDTSVKAEGVLRQKGIYKFLPNGRTQCGRSNAPLKSVDKNGKHLATGLYVRTKNGEFEPLAGSRFDLKQMQTVAVVAHGLQDELKKDGWMCNMGDALSKVEGEGGVDAVIYANWGNECNEGILNIGGHLMTSTLLETLADIGNTDEDTKDLLTGVMAAADKAGVILDSKTAIPVVERMPAVGELMTRQLVDAGFKPESGLFIGYSLGAHLLGYIATHYFNGKIARHVGLETANEIVVPPKYHVWGDAAQRTEFYKTGMISSATPYAQENYQLTNIKVQKNGDNTDKTGANSQNCFLEPLFFYEANKHGYAYKWFTHSITNGKSKYEGYWSSPERYKQQKSATNEYGFVEIDVSMCLEGEDAFDTAVTKNRKESRQPQITTNDNAYRSDVSIDSSALAERLYDFQCGARMISCNPTNSSACTYRLILPSKIVTNAKLKLQGSTGNFGWLADNKEKGKRILNEEIHVRKSICDGRFTVASFSCHNKNQFKPKTITIPCMGMRIVIYFEDGPLLNLLERNLGVLLLERNCKDAGGGDRHDYFSIKKITIDGKEYLPENFQR